MGNPGPRYEATRHNVGWWLLDSLRRRWSATPFQEEDLWLRARAELPEAGEVWLVKPLTYVNRSGIAVRVLVERSDLELPEDLLVVIDDVALEPGTARFRARGSAGGHNGLESVERALGTREYSRLRIGVGATPPDRDLSDWVLSEFDARDEDAILDRLSELGEAVEVWAREGIEVAMNRFNSRFGSKQE